MITQEQLTLLPQVMLLSIINMHLRDTYDSLDTLCEDNQLTIARVLDALPDYDYHPEINQFRIKQ